MVSFIIINPGRDSRPTAAVGQQRESVVDTREKLAGIVAGGFKMLRRNSRDATTAEAIANVRMYVFVQVELNLNCHAVSLLVWRESGDEARSQKLRPRSCNIKQT
jgi:hypothetical protein